MMNRNGKMTMSKSCSNCRYEDRTIKELPCGRCVSIANLTGKRYSEYQQRENTICEETTFSINEINALK
ncbi:hypothetical protein [Megamonas hypermegale]|uniref:hypothetical protein n=1 Tax=Megamonas hypermegale TaxID=158847 RepID=UPI00242DBB77|nr:hypothetical protein [Megamonas hypermegale]